MRTTGKATDLITFSRSSVGTALRKIGYGSDVAPLFSAYGIVGSGTWAASGSDYVFEDTVGSQVRPGVSWPTNGLSAGIYLVEVNIASITGATQVRVDGIGAADQLIGTGENSFVIQVTSKATLRIRIEDTSTSVGDGFALTSFSVKPVLFDQGDLTLFNHPADIPRVEYDANGNVLGLLVEESRVNLVTYSEDIDDSSWYKGRATVSSERTEGPDGIGNSGRKIEGTADAGTHRIATVAFNATSGTTYAGSVYMKEGEDNSPRLALKASNEDAALFSDINATFDLTNGTASANGFIEHVGNGWYRCSIISTATATASARLFVYLDDGGSLPFEGQGVYIYGAQVEAGAFPTSYIPTSGSTATRAADVASIATSEFGYRDDEGTVVVEAEYFDTNTAVRIVEFHDGTSNQRTLIGGDNYHPFMSGGGNIDNPDVVIGQFNKIAVGLKENDIASVANGSSSVYTDTSATLSVAPTVLGIGSQWNNSVTGKNHIKSIKYIPRRLTNDQLQEITS